MSLDVQVTSKVYPSAKAVHCR